MRNLEDKVLFQLIRSGEQNALAALFLRHYDHLRHYGLRIVKNPSGVEDCIQDLFAYIFEHRETLGEVKNGKAYLFTSLRRRLIESRKKDSRVQYDGSFEEGPTGINFEVHDLPTQETVSAHQREMLVHSLNLLTWRQKEAVYLRYYNNLSTEEIAVIMGIRKQTVLNTIYQALQKLRRHKVSFRAVE